jgi:hypothetical protein
MAKLQAVSVPSHSAALSKPLAADNARIQSPQEYSRYPLPAEFTEASHQFADQLYDVAKRTHQTGTVLRLVQHYFAGSKQDSGLMEDDFAQIVDLLINTLPHHYTDINDPFDRFELSARQVVRNGCAREGKAQVILEAMTIAARGDSTPESLSGAAAKVLDIANADPAYEPDWQTFIDVVESRGYTVSTEEHKGVRMLPSVSTPEMVKLRRKQSRAVAKLVATVNQSTAASREVSVGKGRQP